MQSTSAATTPRKRWWKVIRPDEIKSGYREFRESVKIRWQHRGDPVQYQLDVILKTQEQYDDVLRVHRIGQVKRGEYEYAVIARPKDGE